MLTNGFGAELWSGGADPFRGLEKILQNIGLPGHTTARLMQVLICVWALCASQDAHTQVVKVQVF